MAGRMVVVAELMVNSKANREGLKVTHDEMISRAVALLKPHWADDRVHGDVGSVVVAENGDVFEGVCVDTTSWGICAERSALAAMITAGHYTFTQVVAVCRSAETGKIHVLAPCGVCREFMRQIAPDNLHAEVVLGRDRSMTLRELLPEHEWPAPLD